MGLRSLLWTVLTLFCLVEEIKAGIRCTKIPLLMLNKVGVSCNPVNNMKRPTTIDRIERIIKSSEKDIKLDKVDKL